MHFIKFNISYFKNKVIVCSYKCVSNIINNINDDFKNHYARFTKPFFAVLEIDFSVSEKSAFFVTIFTNKELPLDVLIGSSAISNEIYPIIVEVSAIIEN